MSAMPFYDHLYCHWLHVGQYDDQDDVVCGKCGEIRHLGGDKTDIEVDGCGGDGGGGIVSGKTGASSTTTTSPIHSEAHDVDDEEDEGELSSSSNRRLLRRNLNGSWDGAASASSSLTSIPAPVKYVGSPCLRLTYGGGRLFRPIVYLVLQLNSFNVCVCGTPPMSIYGLFIRLILLFETSSLSMYMD